MWGPRPGGRGPRVRLCRAVRAGCGAGQVSDLLPQVAVSGGREAPRVGGEAVSDTVTFLLWAAAGTPTARSTPSAATAEAGVRGVFPGASEGEGVGFLPLFSYWAPLLHCPVLAFLRPAKYQQAVDYDAFSDLFRGKRFLCQPAVLDYFSFKLL